MNTANYWSIKLLLIKNESEEFQDISTVCEYISEVFLISEHKYIEKSIMVALKMHH